MSELHIEPAKLFRGEDEFCEVYGWTVAGQVSETAITFGGLITALPMARKVWKMVCEREPHVRGINNHSLRRGTHRIQIEIEHAMSHTWEGKTYWIATFTSSLDAEFPPPEAATE